MAESSLGDRYCQGCGRQMIPKQEDQGIDSRTGERVYETILVCPRFQRSWRNLWFGGWRHYGCSISDEGQFGRIELEISWR